ncbi:MAG: hypothetical protein KIT48_01700 [Pseudolabrys sp.]|nr:hypothetical protein [Pseudolabrys sp.]
MKYVLPVALLLAASTAAQAKLTPFDGTQERAAPAVSTPADTSAARASAEQQYFQAPTAESTSQAGRCSVSTFVFSKMRLAQACY